MAASLLHVVLAIAPQSLPRLAEVALIGVASRSVLGSALTFGVVFGLLPLGVGGARCLVLRDGGRGLTSSSLARLARRGFVLAQVALAVVLLAARC